MRPPGILTLLARLLTPRSHREYVLGDLDELYAARAREHGRVRATVRYLSDVLALPRLLGGGRGVRRPVPPPWRQPGMTLFDVAADIRQAIRALWRQPKFTFVLVATLALGIGPTTAVLGMVDQMLRRPLSGAGNSEVAAYLWLSDPEEEFGGAGLTLRHFDELRAQASLVAGLASYGLTGQHVNLDGGRPVRVSANTIYGDFFEVLGVRASEGRLLTGAETTLDSNPLVVVISEDLRGRLFGADEPAVGRTLQMNGQPVEIVGVAGGGFRGPVRGEPRDAWLPHGALVPLLGFPRERLESPRSAMHGDMLILPRPGATLVAIEQQVTEVLARLGEADPERAEEFGRLRPMTAGGLHQRRDYRDRTSRTLAMMTWAAALLLAIACANVANLLLFQNLARRGSLATLRALGASTGRIARQHLVRSLVLAALGGTAGVGLGWLVALWFRGELLLGMPAFDGLRLDRGVLLWIMGSVVATAVLFGAVPAATAGRFDLGAALQTSRTRTTGRLGLVRAALSAGQIAMTLALLVGGLLMVRTIMNLNAVETGVNIERVVGVTVDVPADLEPPELHALQRAVVEAVASEPGVEEAALDLYGPHGSQFVSRVGLPTDGESERASRPRTLTWQVSPGWFELFGLRPVSGRTFEDADWRIPSTGRVVLTASLARRLFGRTDVEGRTVHIPRGDPEERLVIGVVENYTSMLSIAAARTDPEESLRPSGPTDAVFLPYGELPLFQMTVFAKVAAGAAGVPDRVGAIVASLITDVPAPFSYLLSDRVDRIHREELLLRRLLLLLSTFGALMSGVGLFAAIYFVVSSRKREFGIRLALGADGARIVALILRSALVIVGLGVGVGAVVAYPLTQALRGRLYGIAAFDIVSYAVAALALAVVAVLACVSPARAALRSDPATVLRQE